MSDRAALRHLSGSLAPARSLSYHFGEHGEVFIGTSYGVICRDCGHHSVVQDGGGFIFHLLRCDRCGVKKEVDFSDIGELHVRYLKSLGGPYSIVTRELDSKVRRAYDGEPISERDYHAAVEELAGNHRCGGRFRFDAPARCRKCRSKKLKRDPETAVLHYD